MTCSSSVAAKALLFFYCFTSISLHRYKFIKKANIEGYKKLNPGASNHHIFLILKLLFLKKRKTFLRVCRFFFFWYSLSWSINRFVLNQ